jgi:hypothetical protein
MPTEGTEKVLGGTRYRRYPDPVVKGTPNGYGLYSWSAFNAYCAEVNDVTGVVEASAEPNTLLLLFLSDIPALLRAAAFDGSSLLYTVAMNTLTSGLKTTMGGSTDVTLDAFGQVASGYTGAAAQVFCTGFPVVTCSWPVREAASQYSIEVTANSPVVCSPVGGPTTDAFGEPLCGFSGTPLGKGVSPIILRDSDYTEAIKANDNIIVSTDGTDNVAYVVVGLWHVLTPK